MILLSLYHRLYCWMKRKLKVDVFELQGDEIVAGWGRNSQQRIRVDDIRTWCVYPEMVFDVIQIELAGGQTVIWCDYFNDLTNILWEVAVDRHLSIPEEPEAVTTVERRR